MGRATTRTKAVILTTQRTGSTFLVTCLNTHPQIECASEILIGAPDDMQQQRPSRFRNAAKVANILRRGAFLPATRMRRFFACGTGRVRAFKAMYNQLANPFALRYLRDDESIRILHLRRKNLLKVHVSRLLMRKRDHVQTRTPVDAVRVRVDPAQAMREMRNARSKYERFDMLFSRHPRLPLAYESLFDGQMLDTTTAGYICDFLEVERYPMQSSIMKLNPELLQDMVENYDELAAALSRTEFADMLD